jgi:hypothetical protein
MLLLIQNCLNLILIAYSKAYNWFYTITTYNYVLIRNRFSSSKQRVTHSYTGFSCVCLLCGAIPRLSIQVHLILQKKYF